MEVCEPLGQFLSLYFSLTTSLQFTASIHMFGTSLQIFSNSYILFFSFPIQSNTHISQHSTQKMTSTRKITWKIFSFSSLSSSSSRTRSSYFRVPVANSAARYEFYLSLVPSGIDFPGTSWSKETVFIYLWSNCKQDVTVMYRLALVDVNGVKTKPQGISIPCDS